MANAALVMSGPKKIIELEGKEPSRWRIEDGALHLWNGKLWSKELVGCVQCVEKEGNDHITFSRSDNEGEEHFHCMEHGLLDEVKYSMVKQYTVTIGGIVRTGEQSAEDTMLFPSSMSTNEKTSLIKTILDEMEEDEEEAGLHPEDE